MALSFGVCFKVAVCQRLKAVIVYHQQDLHCKHWESNCIYIISVIRLYLFKGFEIIFIEIIQSNQAMFVTYSYSVHQYHSQIIWIVFLFFGILH